VSVTLKKQELIKVRVTSKQKQTLIAAAKRDGIDEVSTWLRSLGLRRASATEVPK
jgi:hypothetical protein